MSFIENYRSKSLDRAIESEKTDYKEEKKNLQASERAELNKQLSSMTTSLVATSTSSQATQVTDAQAMGLSAEKFIGSQFTPEQVKAAKEKGNALRGAMDLAIKVGSERYDEISYEEVSGLVNSGAAAIANKETAENINSITSVVGIAIKASKGEDLDWVKISGDVANIAGADDSVVNIIGAISKASKTGKVPYKEIYREIASDSGKNAMIAMDKIEYITARSIKTGELDLDQLRYYSYIAANGNTSVAREIERVAVQSKNDGAVDYKGLTIATVKASGDKKKIFYVEVIEQAEKAYRGEPVEYSSVTISAIQASGIKNADLYAASAAAIFDYANDGKISKKSITGVISKATGSDKETLAIIDGVFDYVVSGGDDPNGLIKALNDEAIEKYNIDVEGIYKDLDNGINNGEWDSGSLTESLFDAAGVKTDVDVYEIANQLQSLYENGTVDSDAVAQLVQDELGVRITEEQVASITDSISNGDGYALTDDAIAVLGENIGVDLSMIDSEAVVDTAVSLLDAYNSGESISDILSGGDLNISAAIDSILGVESGTAEDLIAFLGSDSEYSDLYDSVLAGDTDLSSLGGVLGEDGIAGLLSSFTGDSSVLDMFGGGDKEALIGNIRGVLDKEGLLQSHPGNEDKEEEDPPCLDEEPAFTRSALDYAGSFAKKASGSDWFIKNSSDKIIHAHFGLDNGEPTEYDVQLDRENGNMSVSNGIDQFIKFDFKNEKIIVKSPKCILLESEAITLDAKDVYVTGNFKVYKHAKFLRSFNLKGDLLVRDNLTVQQDTVLEEKLLVQNDTHLEEKLLVDNDTHLKSKLDVDKKGTFNADVDMMQALKVVSNSTLVGPVSITGAITAAGAFTLAGLATIPAGILSEGIITAKEFVKV